MSSATVRVFVSSTWLDLLSERQAVETTIQRLRETKYIGMEYFGSRDEDPCHASLDEVDRSQVYIGIFGGRYGSGITEVEYRQAYGHGIPCLIYIKDETLIPSNWRDLDIEPSQRLADLKDELRKLHTVSDFTTPDDLATKVATDLHNWLFDKYLAPILERASLLGDEAELRRLIESVRDAEALRTVLAQRGIAIGGDVRQSLLITGNRNIINFLVQGITALPTDYASRVENFLVEYLSTPDLPVPFGGREADMARLDMWLCDPQSPPYLLLAAPAGRGKSALLVHWSRQISSRQDSAVVFFPISVRFRTNLSSVVFAALTARLAVLHGDKVPSDFDTPMEVWRGLMMDYLKRPLPDGRHLLLIVDGVDEAADWELGPDLFPLDPPQGLHIVLSTRYRAGDVDAASWLRSLGWDRPGLALALDLAPLDPQGVADVLRHMDLPLNQLGTRVDIVAELYRLSEGDPLLVRLYVDDLWARRSTTTCLSPEDLQAIRPGLDGYFSRWWEDQRRLWGKDSPLRDLTAQALLAILSCARGPMSLEDVMQLAPPGVGLNSFALEEALHALGRFVIGDGRQQGYVFSHPRLQYYFRERLPKQERQQWERRFLDWGQETLSALNERQLAPENVSPYILQYYGAHLEWADPSPERFLALASNGWRQAWERLEGSYAGFLNDVDRVWRSVERANWEDVKAERTTHHLGSEIRCAIVHASVNSMSTNIPPALMAALVREGIWSPAQGLSYARQVSDLGQRSEVLLEFIPLIPMRERRNVLLEVLEAVRAIVDIRIQTEILIALLPHLSIEDSWEVLHKVLKTVLTVRSDTFRARVLIALMPRLPAPLLPEVLEAARAIEDARARTEVLIALLPHLSTEDRWMVLHQALETFWTSRSEFFRTEALMVLAPQLPELLLRQILETIQTIQSDSSQAKLLTILVPHLPEPLLPQALETAWKIRSDSCRIEALIGLVPRLHTSILPEVLEAARAIEDAHARTEVLMALLPHLSEVDRREILYQLLESTQAIEDAHARTEVLMALLPHLSEVDRREILYQLLESTQAIEDDTLRAEALIGLVPYLPKHLLRQTSITARNIRSGASRIEVLMALAPRLPVEESMEVMREVLGATRTIEDVTSRAEALIGLAPYLPESLLHEALEATQAIEDATSRAEALIGLVSYLSESMLSQALEATQRIQDDFSRTRLLTVLTPRLPESLLLPALKMIQDIQSKPFRTEALMAIAPRLPEKERREALHQALEADRAIEDAGARTEALIGLAPYLSESMLSQALEATQRIQDDFSRTRLLTTLTPYLPESLLHGVLETFQTLQNASSRTRVLEVLAPRLPEPLVCAALKIVLTSKDGFSRAQELAALAPHLPASLLSEALEAIRTLPSDSSRAEGLIALAPHLPEPLVRKALKIVLTCKDNSSQVRGLEALAAHLPASLVPKALEAVRTLPSDSSRARVLTALAPRLSASLVPKALEAVRTLPSDSSRAEGLIALAPHLPESLVCEALQIALTSEDSSFRAPGLAALAAHLPESLLPEALKATRTLQSDPFRAQVLTALAPYLPVSLVPEALEAILTIRDDYYSREALKALAPRLSEPLICGALQIVLISEDDSFRGQGLAALAPHLPASLVPKALEAIRTLQSDSSRVRVLVALAPRLPVSLMPEALQIALTSEDDAYCAQGLAALAPHLPESLLSEALETIRILQSDSSRVRVLTALAQRLPEPLVCRVLEAVRTLQSDSSRAQVLTALAFNLAALAPISLYPLWQELLHFLAGCPRRTLVKDLCSLLPVIIALGGSEAVIEAACAIQETGRWWP